ncbi:hypothetical protein [Chryseobacterium daeguense]|uniref:hypothetical protein n=1 Tax=Chryseobacterium daeguense TaxID=412438 RepID=UPI0003FDA103|nr:hypothetical protein [Chryseobacterium daeguense]
MEIEKKLCVKDLISRNLEMFYKLDLIGIKSISSAIDLMRIYTVYQEYDWIESKTERKKVTASACKVSVGLVEKAIYLMNQDLKTNKKNPTFQ